MRDRIGNELEIGQVIVTNFVGYSDRLCIGKVIGFTPQKVRVNQITSVAVTAVTDTFLRFPEQVAVVQI